jgi:F0F1-type ATP synthase membrane subunit b/b'
MKKVLSDRDLYIESILSEVRGLKSDADKIEKDSAAALEAVKTASAETESKLTTAFEEQSLKEKKALDDLFLKKTQEESDLLTKSSEKAFAYALDQMDEMVEAAAARILGSTRKAL